MVLLYLRRATDGVISPAVSLAWRASEEPFIKDKYNWISNLKFRLGWGKTGNVELKENDVYPTVSTFAYGTSVIGNTLTTSMYESRYVNDNLTWATVTNYELGIEAGFLQNKVGFELDLYKKRTTTCFFVFQFKEFLV